MKNSSLWGQSRNNVTILRSNFQHFLNQTMTPNPGITKQNKDCNQRPEYQRAGFPGQMGGREEVCEGENFFTNTEVFHQPMVEPYISLNFPTYYTFLSTFLPTLHFFELSHQPYIQSDFLWISPPTLNFSTNHTFLWTFPPTIYFVQPFHQPLSFSTNRTFL